MTPDQFKTERYRTRLVPTHVGGYLGVLVVHHGDVIGWRPLSWVGALLTGRLS